MAVPAGFDVPSTAPSSFPAIVTTVASPAVSAERISAERILPERSEIAEALDWRGRALCSSDETTKLFFPVGVTGAAAVQIEKAKQVCTECPVQMACLEYAITTNQEYGIWGGASEEERRAIRRVWRKEQREKKAHIAAERKAQREAQRRVDLELDAKSERQAS